MSLKLRGDMNEPVAEESSRNFLYKIIRVTVNEFNKKLLYIVRSKERRAVKSTCIR